MSEGLFEREWIESAGARERYSRGGESCRVYWGTHGCEKDRGHLGSHVCCCDCRAHTFLLGNGWDSEGRWLCVGRWPYYGWRTKFYGEDPAHPRLAALGVRLKRLVRRV